MCSEGGFVGCLNEFVLHGAREVAIRGEALWHTVNGKRLFDVLFVDGDGKECWRGVVARSFSEARLLAFGVVPLGEYSIHLVSADEALYDVSIAYGTPQPFCRYGNDAEISLEASSLPLSVSGTEIDRDAF